MKLNNKIYNNSFYLIKDDKILFGSDENGYVDKYKIFDNIECVPRSRFDIGLKLNINEDVIKYKDIDHYFLFNKEDETNYFKNNIEMCKEVLDSESYNRLIFHTNK